MSRSFERFHFDLVGDQNSLPFTEGRYKYILMAPPPKIKHSVPAPARTQQ